MALMKFLRGLRLQWQVLTLLLKLRGRPVFAGADGHDGGDDDSGGDGEGDPAGGGGDDDSADGGDGDPDWKRESRKHERRAKKSESEVEKLRKQLKDREDADKSESEKEVEKAREEARAEARKESEQERRHDRLELAATRLAVKGVELGEGDDAETVKFADPDDALVYVERAIKDGDIDPDDIFDEEGKVQTNALSEALKEILERKPHLRAGSSAKDEPKKKPKGSADGGRGSAGGKDLESMSVDDHFKSVSRVGSK